MACGKEEFTFPPSPVRLVLLSEAAQAQQTATKTAGTTIAHLFSSLVEDECTIPLVFIWIHGSQPGFAAQSRAESGQLLEENRRNKLSHKDFSTLKKGR